ncbi:MAG TPA: tRNA pseudouridine(55) synthase TruB [Rhodocyclaceae bacterium]|nr:tRNA pseudouridine(55) synthase TruB [Rhodocyclaceae bacterium]
MNNSRFPARRPRRHVDGVLLLDKPLGISSNQALQKVRRLYNADKGGHTGTLDPLATGLLPICLGEATKFSGDWLNADKRYRATVRLGVTTVTADAEGEVLQRRAVDTTPSAIEHALAAFTGEIEQIPPMYSALKRDGKPYYEYAREGIELERTPRRVHIHSLALVEILGVDSFIFDVACSKGTYVRTLAADIGEHLGCGAHLSALRRTGLGRLDVADSHTFAALDTLTHDELDRKLHAPDYLLLELPAVELDPVNAVRISFGQAVPWSGARGRIRVYDRDKNFLGVCLGGDEGILQPQRLIAQSPH